MNDDEIITTDNAIQYSICDPYSFTNSLMNDAMMDGMNWKEIISVYIEHNFLPPNLRNKIVHNK